MDSRQDCREEGGARSRLYAHVRCIGYLVGALKILQADKLVDADIENLLYSTARKTNSGFVGEGGLLCNVQERWEFIQGVELSQVRNRIISKLGLQTRFEELYESRRPQPPQLLVNACRGAVAAEVAAEREVQDPVAASRINSTLRRSNRPARSQGGSSSAGSRKTSHFQV